MHGCKSRPVRLVPLGDHDGNLRSARREKGDDIGVGGERDDRIGTVLPQQTCEAAKRD